MPLDVVVDPGDALVTLLCSELGGTAGIDDQNCLLGCTAV
jgi:hypothetical protein